MRHCGTRLHVLRSGDIPHRLYLGVLHFQNVAWRWNVIYVKKKMNDSSCADTHKTRNAKQHYVLVSLQRISPKPGNKCVKYGQKFIYTPINKARLSLSWLLQNLYLVRQLFVNNSDTEFHVNSTLGLAADTKFHTGGYGLHTRGLLSSYVKNAQ